MQLHKRSIILTFLAFRKNSWKNPSPSAISPPIRHACKFFRCAHHYWGLNFHICIPISSLLPILLPCSCLGNRSALLVEDYFSDAHSCEDGYGRIGRTLSHSHPVKVGGDYHFQQKVRLELICLPRLSGEDGGPSQVPATALAIACCTVTLLHPLPIVVIK